MAMLADKSHTYRLAVGSQVYTVKLDWDVGRICSIYIIKPQEAYVGDIIFNDDTMEWVIGLDYGEIFNSFYYSISDVVKRAVKKVILDE